ncbi:hypothetical protein Tco_0796575 [Tanacetum coccineum]
MAERTMEELLRAPTKGYGEAIVLPEINADHFEITTNLLQLVQANPFHGYERENPHTHINSFKRITSTLRFRNVPNMLLSLYEVSILTRRMNTTSRESVSKTDERIDKLADQILTLVEMFLKTLSLPSSVVERESKETTDKEQSNFQGSTAHIPPTVNPILILEPDVPKTLPKLNIRIISATPNRALIDVYEGELIVRSGDERLIFHVDKHPQKHAKEDDNIINFIEDGFREVLRLKKSNHFSSGSTTPFSDSRPNFTSFETSDSLLEEFADELLAFSLTISSGNCGWMM